MSGLDHRLSKAVTARSLIVAALSVVHSLRTRGLRSTLLYGASGSAIPILGELVAVNVLKVLRHHCGSGAEMARASEVKGPNGKRGVPSLNFAGWIALTTSVTLAYQRLESGQNAAYTSDPGDTGGPGSQRAAALLLLSYYLPAAAWALKRERRKYLLYSAPLPQRCGQR